MSRSVAGITAFSDDLLSAAIAFELIEPVSETRDGAESWRVATWKKAALEQRPALVHGAHKAIARVRFTKGDQHDDGLHELLTGLAFAPYRAETVLEFRERTAAELPPRSTVHPQVV